MQPITGFDKLDRVLRIFARKRPVEDDSPSIGTPSQGLVTAVRSGNCVLFASEELSKPCGMPLFGAFQLGLVDYLADSRLIAVEDQHRLRHLQRSDEDTALFDKLLKRVADNFPLATAEYAAKVYSRAGALSLLHEGLRDIPFCGVVTPNLDNLLERVLNIPEEFRVLSDSPEVVAAAMDAGQPFLLKLRGDVKRPETVRIWPEDAVRACPRLVLRAIVGTRTLFFLNTSAVQIDLWMTAAGAKPKMGPHYAILPHREQSPMRRKAVLRDKFGIIASEYKFDYSGPLVEFLRQLHVPAGNNHANAADVSRQVPK